MTLYTIIDIIHTSTTQTATRGRKMRALTEKLRENGISEEEIYNIEGKVILLSRELQKEGLSAHDASWVAAKKIANVNIQE